MNKPLIKLLLRLRNIHTYLLHNTIESLAAIIYGYNLALIDSGTTDNGEDILRDFNNYLATKYNLRSILQPDASIASIYHWHRIIALYGIYRPGEERIDALDALWNHWDEYILKNYPPP